MISKIQSLTKLIQRGFMPYHAPGECIIKSQGVYKEELNCQCIHLLYRTYPEQRCDWVLASAPGGGALVSTGHQGSIRGSKWVL